MKGTHRAAPAILLAAVLTALAFAPASAADEGAPSRWAVARLQGMLTLKLGENHVEVFNDCGPGGFFGDLSFLGTIDVNSSAGVLGSFEYVVERRYGFELSLLYWNRIVDIGVESEDITVKGSPNFILPTIGVNYHFLPGRATDVYAGGLCTLGVIASGFFTDLDVSKDIALGVNLGVDHYFNGPWSVGGTVKYIDFGELDFSLLPPGISGILCDNGLFGIGHMNVISLTAGIGYRF